MIGLGTNVLVRHFAQDDPQQSPVATAIMARLTERDPGFVGLVCLVELVWVMQSCYGLNRQATLALIAALLDTKQFFVEQSEAVSLALANYAISNCEFEDHLIGQCAFTMGCKVVLTFDRKAVRSAGMRLAS